MSEMPLSGDAGRLSRPLRYTIRIALFLALIGFLAYIIQRPLQNAFMANPPLNGLILGALAVGVLIGLREFLRLDGEVRAGNALRGGAAPTMVGRLPFLGPILPALPALPRRLLGPGQFATILESVAVRLDEGRDLLRYLAGLLVFLGLLGTFWGLLETVSSVGGVINTLRTGAEAGVLFEELKSGLSAPLAGMGLSFSSSLFGIAGSLILGFMDLQLGQAQRRFRLEVEDWLATGLSPSGQGGEGAPPAPVADFVQRLDQFSRQLTENAGGARQSTQAMANLAEGIQGLVQHMRSEQQLIRDWVEAQSQRDKETRRLLERLLLERNRAE